jgi:hypothetical protein
MSVVDILENTLRTNFFFSLILNFSFSFISLFFFVDVVGEQGGIDWVWFENVDCWEEVKIWDSSPGREGEIESRDSIVTFNYWLVLYVFSSMTWRDIILVSSCLGLGFGIRNLRSYVSKRKSHSTRLIPIGEDLRVVYIIRISSLD